MQQCARHDDQAWSRTSANNPALRQPVPTETGDGRAPPDTANLRRWPASGCAGYNTLAELFGKSSSPKDAKHVVWITASVENGCEYCVAGDSTLALRAGLTAETVEALRAGKPLPDAALEAARRLTHAIVDRRGWVDDSEIDAFLDAGYTQATSWTSFSAWA